MRDYIEKRAIELGEYIVNTKDTVRSAGEKFGISKSTVHKDITVALEKVNKPLFLETRKVLEQNKEERHIRGGEATKQKYKKKFLS